MAVDFIDTKVIRFSGALPRTLPGKSRPASIRWVGLDSTISAGHKCKVTGEDPNSGTQTVIFASVAQVSNWCDMQPLFEDAYVDVTVETLGGGEVYLYLR